MIFLLASLLLKSKQFGFNNEELVYKYLLKKLSKLFFTQNYIITLLKFILLFKNNFITFIQNIYQI